MVSSGSSSHPWQPPNGKTTGKRIKGQKQWFDTMNCKPSHLQSDATCVTVCSTLADTLLYSPHNRSRKTKITACKSALDGIMRTSLCDRGDEHMLRFKGVCVCVCVFHFLFVAMFQSHLLNLSFS